MTSINVLLGLKLWAPIRCAGPSDGKQTATERSCRAGGFFAHPWLFTFARSHRPAYGARQTKTCNTRPGSRHGSPPFREALRHWLRTSLMNICLGTRGSAARNGGPCTTLRIARRAAPCPPRVVRAWLWSLEWIPEFGGSAGSNAPSLQRG